MKSTEKLILGVYSLKNLNHIGGTECLQSNLKNLLHSEGPLNHQNTPTTQVQNIMKSGRFLGGAPVRFYVNGNLCTKYLVPLKINPNKSYESLTFLLQITM